MSIIALRNIVQLPAGSHIKTFSPQYGIDHHGIFAGVYGGQPWVFHSVKPGGFTLAPFDQFHHGLLIEIVAMPVPGSTQQEEILMRAHQAIGTDWTLLGSNCEHLARWVFSGVAESKQVQTGVAISVFLAGLALIVYDRPSTRRRRS